MPEGPEIRTVTLSLAQSITDQVLRSINWTPASKHHKLFDVYDRLHLPSQIKAVTCRGKKIIFVLACPTGLAFITSTLGMTGRWTWTPTAHSHLWLEMDRVLYYDDQRHFGNLELWFDYTALTAKLTKEIGPDLLAYALQVQGQLSPIEQVDPSEELTPSRWLSIMNRLRHKQVCAVLMDQRYMSGIGNYLKSEILYRAQIAPHRLVGSLSETELLTLRQVALDTIYESFCYGGLTIATYWDPDGRRGSYQPRVYNRTTDDLGNPVRRDSYDDKRTTYWCPDVQH